MIKILFFDLNIIGLKRYPLDIAKSLNEENADYFFYFLYEEDPSNIRSDIQKLLPDNAILKKIKVPLHKYLTKVIYDINPDHVFVFAQRIPDTAIVSIANKMNIHTYMFQHGLYIPFMKKNKIIFLNKMYKIIRYIGYIYTISIVTNENFINLLYAYFNIYIRGYKIVNTKIEFKKFNVDKVFVYGNYWKTYHSNEFGYDNRQQYVVGTPDLHRLEELKHVKTEDAVCYICQTLVEDDRLDKYDMLNFLDILSTSINDKKLYIKLHLRSNINIYKHLLDKKNIIIVDDIFPKCDKYIGHYSSMLALSLKITSKVFLWKFDNHNTYPSYLTENSLYYSNDPDVLKNFINNNNKNNINESLNKNSIDEYFYYDSNPIRKIINKLDSIK